jgi:hypothetical protein
MVILLAVTMAFACCFYLYVFLQFRRDKLRTRQGHARLQTRDRVIELHKVDLRRETSRKTA